MPDAKPLVFLFGTQKSGTTWLRNVVGDVIPIERKAEWYLPALAEGFETQLLRYANHGADAKPALLAAALEQAWRGLLRAGGEDAWADKSAYPCTAEAGRRDDLFPYAAAMKRFMAPGSRRIMIVRDPRDVLVSSKHFFLRGEHPFDPGYLEQFMLGWARCNLHWLGASLTLVIRYEDLKRGFVSEARRLFDAAGLEMTEEAFASIVRRHATIDEMQRTNPHFYRKGIVGDWRRELSDEDIRCIWDVAGEAMSVFGYGRSDTEPDERVTFNRFEAATQVPIDLLLTQTWSEDATVRREGDVLELMIRGGDLSVVLDSIELPPVPEGRKLVLMLELGWLAHQLDGDDLPYFDRQLSCRRGPGFGISIVRAGERPPDAPLRARIQARSYLYEDSSVTCLEIDRVLAYDERPCLHLFNGPFVEPFRARIHALRYRVVAGHSQFAAQLGDLQSIDAAAA